MFQSLRISRLNPPHPPSERRRFGDICPQKNFAFPRPFISNKAASLIVAPDKTVFVGDRNHSRRPKSTENVFHLPAAKRPPLSLRRGKCTREPIPPPPPRNRAYFDPKSNADRMIRIHLIPCRRVIGNVRCRWTN